MDESVQGRDYNWYIAWPGIYEPETSGYIVIKYRTEVSARNEFYYGSPAHPFPTITSTFTLEADGEWHYLYINLYDLGATDPDACMILRFDFLNDAPDGSTIDIESLTFYKTAADVDAVINPPEPPKTYSDPSDYASAGTIVGPNSAAGFVPIYNAINGNMGGTANEAGYPAISGGDLLWLSNTSETLDLSKYSKAIITFACDRTNTTGKYDANAGNNKFEILNFNGTLATGDYELPEGDWKWNTCEIDLTNVDYEGEVLFRVYDKGLSGTWYVIHSIILVP